MPHTSYFPSECINGTISSFKAMLQWLANYSIKASSFRKTIVNFLLFKAHFKYAH